MTFVRDVETVSRAIRDTEEVLAALRAERIYLINEALDSGQTWDQVQARAGVSRATVMAARRAGREGASAPPRA